MTSPSNPVWFISGCSSGFGRDLCKAVLARGWRVVVTAREPASIEDIVAQAPDRAIALALDVQKPDQVEKAVAAAVDRFGGIDVLVNNAGYGYQCTVEESEEAQYRDMFETNFFGLVHVTKAVLPLLRAKRGGHIFNIGSIAGVIGMPTAAFYSATKHAVEGFSEALSGEVGPLGIAVTVVEPGPFRTDFGGRSIRVTPITIADYVPGLGARMDAAATMSGTQAGDPARAADAMVSAYLSPQPPRWLLLGRGAADRAEAKFQQRLDELRQWRNVANDADFPQ